MKKRTSLISAVLLVIFILSLIPAYAADNTSIPIDLEKGVNTFKISFTIPAEPKGLKNYGGASLTFRVDEDINYITHDFNEALPGQKVELNMRVNSDKSTEHAFGFISGYPNNNFSASTKFLDVTFEYKGDTEKTITIMDIRVTRYNESGGADTVILEDVKYTISRKSDGSGGSTDVPPGGSGNTETIGDSETPLGDLGNRSKYFDDVDESWPWAFEQIDSLYERGVVKGVAERMYAPARNITRADFIVMVVRAFELTSDSTENFNDVAAGSYYAEALAIAKALGIAKGYEDGSFKPTDPIIRQDMMLIIYRVMEFIEKPLAAAETSELSVFADGGKVSDYAKAEVAALVKSGLVLGDGTNVNPQKNTTRAEMAVLLYRILEQVDGNTTDAGIDTDTDTDTGSGT